MAVQEPLVSVIALCFNHSRFLLECLDSIRSQTYKSVQLLIMDDCSTDDSVAIIRNWIFRNDVTCTFVAHTKNQGVCSTLNEAISHAKGKYVSMIATDDVWMPEKIERQAAYMESLPESVAVLYSDAYQINEAGEQLPGLFIKTHRRLSHFPEGNILPALLEGNFVPAMTTLIRRSAFETIGPYDERLCYEDFDMWLRMSQQFMFAFSPYVSAKYRIVDSSIMRSVIWPAKSIFLASEFIVYSKCLDLGTLDKTMRRKVVSKLTRSAHQLRRKGYANSTEYLRSALRHDLKLATLGMLLLSSCGIPYESFEGRISRVARKSKSYLSWRFSSMRSKGG